MQACVYNRIKASSPRPHTHTCGHATHQLTFLPSVEAFDPYITTQVSGTHTIARHMDNESKTPRVST